MTFRCDWCGRFYSSPLPDGSACRDHIPEHNARLRASIERFNSRLVAKDGGVQVPADDPHAPAAENRP